MDGAQGPPPPRPDCNYVTKKELAARTGLSKSTIQRLKEAGKIPFFQPHGDGGRVLYPHDAIERACRPHQANTIENTAGSGGDAPPASPAGPQPGPAAPVPRKLPGPRARWRSRRQEKHSEEQ
jgi:excisionase family DNA binding protein